MNRLLGTSTRIAIACVAAVVAVGGCAWNSPEQNPGFAQRHETTSNALRHVPLTPPTSNETSAASFRDSHGNAGMVERAEPSSIALRSTFKKGPNRESQLIGLFGEFAGAGGGAEAGSLLDGGNNLHQITVATEGACVDPDVDRSGMNLAFSSTMHRRSSDIYIKAVNGETVTQLTADPADDVMPAFSPDGKTIAFASNRTGNWDVFTTSLDGRQIVQITSDTDHELHPSWSPDGKMLAYCKFGSQSSRWEIWVVEAANPAVRHFLGYGVFPQWCPDVARNKILFQRAKQRGSRDYSIWTLDYVNGQAMYPTEIVSAANAALINPAWSPDGSRVVFVAVVDPDQTPNSTGRPMQSDLWIVNLDGTERRALTNGQFANFQPVWASNGAVYFVSDRSGVDNIWAVTASGSISNSRSQLAGASDAEPEK
jgi:TolB protein